MESINPNIYTILVTYNGENWIQPCIHSLNRSTIPTKVILVDNASHDKTIELAKKLSIEEIIALPSNLGFGKANNVGIEYAVNQKADYIFLINQDARIKEDTLSILEIAARKFPEFGLLSPVHLDKTGQNLDFGFALHLKEEQHKIWPPKKRSMDNSPIEINFINAALWFIPILTIKTVGGFDPLFFHYGEDNDFCNRVLASGKKIGVVTQAYGFHDRVEKGLKGRDQLLREFENSFLIRLKHANGHIFKMYLRLFSEIIIQKRPPQITIRDLISIWVKVLMKRITILKSRKEARTGNFPYLFKMHKV